MSRRRQNSVTIHTPFGNVQIGSAGVDFHGAGIRGYRQRGSDGTVHWRKNGAGRDGPPGYYRTYGNGRYQEYVGGGYGYAPRGYQQRYDYAPPPQPRYDDDEWRQREWNDRDRDQGRGTSWDYRPAVGWDGNRPIFQSDLDAQREAAARGRGRRGHRDALPPQQRRDEPSRRSEGTPTRPSPSVAATGAAGVMIEVERDRILQGGVTLDELQQLLTAKNPDGSPVISNDFLTGNSNNLGLSADIADGKFGRGNSITLVGRNQGAAAQANGELVQQAQALIAAEINRRNITTPARVPAPAARPAPATTAAGELTQAEYNRILDGGLTLEELQRVVTAKFADGTAKGQPVVSTKALEALIKNNDLDDGIINNTASERGIRLVDANGHPLSAQDITRAKVIVQAELSKRPDKTPVAPAAQAPRPAAPAVPTQAALDAAINAMNPAQKAAFAAVLNWQVNELSDEKNTSGRKEIYDGILEGINIKDPIEVADKRNITLDADGVKKIQDAYKIAEQLIMGSTPPLSKQDQIARFTTMIRTIQPVAPSSFRSPAEAAAGMLKALGVVTAENKPRVQYALADAEVIAANPIQLAVARAQSVEGLPTTPAAPAESHNQRTIEV